MKKLGIIGLGLMGGSLGLAARRAGLAECISGFARRHIVREQALCAGVVDEAPEDMAAVVAGADIVVFCVPVLTIPELAAECSRHFSHPCIVTDVGSTKSYLEDKMVKALSGTKAVFVGSHPVAGSEMSGLSAARADLYDSAPVIVTGHDSDKNAVERVESMWRSVGADTYFMSAREHDLILAKTSHLPHLIASLLVKTVLGGGRESVALFCGGGFRDTTRIAEGSEHVWHDIIKTNHKPVIEELERFSLELNKMIRVLKSEDFEGVRKNLATVRKLREEYRGIDECG